MSVSAPTEREGRWRSWIVPLAVLVALAFAFVLLRRQLQHIQMTEVLAAARAIQPERVLAALLLTVATYCVLPSYDALALRYVGRSIPLRQSAVGSLIAYGISQTLGFQSMTGGAIRYRLWSSWGLPAPEIARAAAFASATFMLGLVTVGGGALLLEPGTVLAVLHVQAATGRAVGVLLLVLPAAYLLWAARTTRREIVLSGWSIAVPSLPVAVAQLAIALADWTVAGAVLFVLLPLGHTVSFPAFLGVFVLAQASGLISHVPGGLGVFELVMLAFLGPHIGADLVTGALLTYRAVYYLIPLVAAVFALAWHEARLRRVRLAATASATAALTMRWGTALLPEALSLLLFAAGVALLLAGALPIARHATVFPAGAVPLPLKEVSHFFGSIAGVLLLVLAWATQQRLDGAYRLSVGTLAIGAFASAFAGAPPSVSLLLTGVLVGTLFTRSAFTRRSALTDEFFSPGWILAVGAVVGATLWLGFFSFRHVEFRGELWWRFTEDADAPRFLRASVGAAATLLAFGMFRLLRHSRLGPPAASSDLLARVEALARAAPGTGAQFALLADKSFLISEKADGFLMYALQGRCWVSLGDPIGPAETQRELAWRFREEAARRGAWTVFYKVSADQLPLYVDLGLALVKLGEEARVPLQGFSLEGGSRRGLRQTQRSVEEAGARFEVIAAERVPGVLPELRAVSDDWLAARKMREKGFSLGRFDERYLARFPVAVVRMNDRIVAFANLLASGEREELAPDLMRYSAHAPPRVMEYLFTRLLLWGASEGFRWCNLGMAPLSGLEHRRDAPLVARAGDFLYRHGESFYGFQGLRQFKQKFHPQWAPRFLAAPGGLALPRVLASLAILVSGGVSGVVRK